METLLPGVRVKPMDSGASVQWVDALRILERAGAIAQATLTKSHPQRIPELREAIEDLSKGRIAMSSTSWTSLEQPMRKPTTSAV
jgi:hypothetical protein